MSFRRRLELFTFFTSVAAVSMVTPQSQTFAATVTTGDLDKGQDIYVGQDLIIDQDDDGSTTDTIFVVIGGLIKEGNGSVDLNDEVNLEGGDLTINGGRLILGGDIRVTEEYVYQKQGDMGGEIDLLSGELEMDSGSSLGMVYAGSANNPYPMLLNIEGGVLDLSGNCDDCITGGGITLSGSSNIETDSAASLGVVISDGSSTGRLVKTGDGSLELDASNTYSGGTDLESGTIIDGNSSAFGTGLISLEDGSTLSFSIDSLTLSNSLDVSGTANVDVPNSQTDTISGVISDGGSPGLLTKTGAGTLALTGANTFSGGLDIEQGTISLGGTGIVLNQNGVPVNISSGGTLDLSGRGGTSNSVSIGTLNGQGSIILGENDALYLMNPNGLYSGNVSTTDPTPVGSGDTADVFYIDGGVERLENVDWSGDGHIQARAISGSKLILQNDILNLTEALNSSLEIGNGNTLVKQLEINDIDTSTSAPLSSLAIDDGSTLEFMAGSDDSNPTRSTVVPDFFSGSGKIEVENDAEVFLDFRNTPNSELSNCDYTGEIVIEKGGEFVLGSDSSGSFESASIQDDGIFAVAPTSDVSVSPSPEITIVGALNGDGTLVVGFRTVDVTGINNLTGINSTQTFSTYGISDISLFVEFGELKGGVDNLGNGSIEIVDGILDVNEDSNKELSNKIADASSTYGSDYSGRLYKDGAGVVTLSGENTYAGGTTINAGGLSAANNSAFGTGSITLGDGTELSFSNDALSLSNDLILNGSPIVNVSNGLGETLSGVISDGATKGKLEKTGSGTLNLLGSNTYSGGSEIAEGDISIGNASALGTGAIEMDAGTEIIFGSGAISLSNGISLTGDPTFEVDGSQVDTISGVIGDGSEPGDLVKTGSGELDLSSQETYTGTTVIQNGKLALTGTSSISSSSNLDVESGATFDISGLTSGSKVTSLSGSGTVNVGSNELQLTAPSGTFSGTISATDPASGMSNVSIEIGPSSAGETLENANVDLAVEIDDKGLLNIDGNVTAGSVSGFGVINLQADSTLDINGQEDDSYKGTIEGLGNITISSGGGISLVGSNVWTGVTTVQSGGDLTLDNPNSNGTPHPPNITGTSFIHDNGSIIIENNTNMNVSSQEEMTISAQIDGSGIFIINNVGISLEGASTFNGVLGANLANIYGNTNTIGLGNISLESSSLNISQNFNGNLSQSIEESYCSFCGDYPSQLTKNGSGIVTLSGQNTYSGGTIINGGGLSAGDNSAFGTGAVTMADGTELSFSLTGLSLSNAITLAGSPSINVDTGQTDTITGVISDGSTVGSLTKIGSGKLILSGSNTFSGGMKINAGIMGYEANSAFGTGSIEMAAGTEIDFDEDELTLSNPISLDGDPTISVADGDTDTISGVIGDGSSPGDLVKTGNGILDLTAANTYSGTTDVQAGTLELSGGGSIAETSDVTLESGSVLDLTNASFVDPSTNKSYSGTQINNIEGSGEIINSSNGYVVLTNPSGSFSGSVVATDPGTGGIELEGTNTSKMFSNSNIQGGIEIDGTGINTDLNNSNISEGVNVTGGNTVTIDGAVDVGSITGGDDSNFYNLKMDAGSKLNITGSVQGAYNYVTLDPESAANSLISITGSSSSAVFVLDNDLNSQIDISSNSVIFLNSASNQVTISGNIEDNGELEFDRDYDKIRITGNISGSGGIIMLSPGGKVILSGDDTFAGAVNIFYGETLIDGTLSDSQQPIYVESQGVIGGIGNLEDNSVVSINGEISPGDDGAGTFSLGSLRLLGQSIVSFDLGEPGVEGGAYNDLIKLSGDLALGGTLNVNADPASGSQLPEGVYSLYDYSGKLSGSQKLGKVPLATGDAAAIQTVIPGKVNLVVYGTQTNIWNGSATQDPAGNLTAGSGTWNISNSNWTDLGVQVDHAWNAGEEAIFEGTSGTVTVDDSSGQVTVGSMDFENTDGNTYTITGGALQASGSTLAVNVGSSGKAEIDSVIQDASGQSTDLVRAC
ncbi:autotransporter-associated beta strand repeat-containing protein [Acetobacter pasteurianus]|uniref:autotransporter-associated beta strand repeat-containing protein n=1 Tax=Acetobacter pasteurianus TaxID=438 RepID=UPI001362B34F|nr:autotransporter-associated beta strand repeat-containing protein [Acetobacter pasteurianus]QHM90249.1 autotransporter-associated beta strand repeat-containing protein [Acetobacter pasteurianus]